jgi:O-antigen/teichoic acid export membrane protein
MESPLTRAGRTIAGTTDNVLTRIVALSIAGRAGSLIVGFGASVALARFLGPAGRGLLALMVSTMTLGLVLTTLGVPLAAVYFSSRRDTDQGGLLGNTLLQGAILAAVMVPAAAVFHRQVADALGEGQGGTTWVLVAALLPVTFLDWTTHAQLQGMLMFGRYSVLTILSRAAYAIGILALLGLAHLGVAGGLIATAFGSLVMIGGSLGPILKRSRPKLDRPLLRRTLSYGLRVQVGSLFQFANGRLDVLIMQFFRPLSQVGYYAVAQTIAELVINLAGAFQVSVLPLVSHYEGDARADTTTVDSTRHYGILAAAASVFNLGFGPLVILFAFGPKFNGAVAPMLILVPGVWFLGLATVIQGDLSGRGRPGLSSALAGGAAVVTLVLDFALIPPFGVVGGALASDGAYFTVGLASLIALHRVTGIPLRRLALPTRSDFSAYAALLRRVYRALRPPPSDPD